MTTTKSVPAPGRFTPGPWIVSKNQREGTSQIDTADGRGTVVQPRAISWAPDARLIAAAPEMLEFVRRVARPLAIYQSPEDKTALAQHGSWVDHARALLKRIEG